jgi:hypothetical protein
LLVQATEKEWSGVLIVGGVQWAAIEAKKAAPIAPD